MSNDKNAMFSQPQDVAGDCAQEDKGTTDPPMAMTFALMIIAFRRKKCEIIMCVFVGISIYLGIVVDVLPSRNTCKCIVICVPCLCFRMLEENTDIFESGINVETMLHIASEFKDTKRHSQPDDAMRRKFVEKDQFEVAFDRLVSAIALNTTSS